MAADPELVRAIITAGALAGDRIMMGRRRSGFCRYRFQRVAGRRSSSSAQGLTVLRIKVVDNPKWMSVLQLDQRFGQAAKHFGPPVHDITY